LIGAAPAAVLAAVSLALLAPAPPQTRCVVGDKRLAELSGLAMDTAGLWAVADGGRRVDLHRLDPAACVLTQTRTARIDPRDTEDLALGPDGALWVADIGDNQRAREAVAVIVVPNPADARRGGESRLHRLRYPDGPHDAEALLVDDAGSPVIVTKDAAGPAGIYRTERAPVGEGPTPLVRVGALALPPSDTSGGPAGGIGTRVVTGAATTADRRVVAVRTYTDAWLYLVTDGDVAAALARPAAQPVRIPLPGEPQGEAIAFQADGTLLSGSESRDGEQGELRAVPGAAALVNGGVPPAPVPTNGPPGVANVAGEEPEWLPAALGAVAVAGFLLLLTAALVRRRG